MEQRKETYKFGSIDVYYSTTQPVTVKNKILEAATLIGKSSIPSSSGATNILLVKFK